MEKYINITEVSNVYTRAALMYRATRYAQAFAPGKRIDTHHNTGTIEVVKGEIFITITAHFVVMTDPTYTAVFLLDEKSGETFIARSADGVEGLDVMNDAPAFLKAESAAKANAGGSFHDWQPGDYIKGWNGWASKCCNVADYIGHFLYIEDENDHKFFAPTLLRVEKIIDMSDDDLRALCFMDWKPEGFDGGSFSDDVPDSTPMQSFTPVQKRSFIQSVCLIRTPSRWVAVDPQGYEYCRYVYFPTSWRTMFADDVAEMEERRALREQEEQAEQAAADKQQAEEYAARAAKAVAIMEAAGAKPIQAGGEITDQRLTANVRRYLQACFDGVKFTVKSYFGNRFERRITWEDGPDGNTVREALAVFMGDKWEVPGEVSDYGGTVFEHRNNELTRRYGKLHYFVIG